MNQDLLIILALLPVLLLGTLFLYHYLFGPLLLSYKITTRRIEIKLFHLLLIRWINFSNISEIREVKWRDAVGILGTVGMVFGEKWSSRVFVKSFILITPKKSFFHRITLTPKDPGAFVAQVKSLIK